MNSLKNFLHKIHWANFLFIILTPLVALFGTWWTLSNTGFVAPTWWLFAGMMMLTGLGITSGYHRLFSHRTYETHGIIRLFLLLFGGASFEGSATEWCCAHRKHHRFVDTDKDPYNVKLGFWHAHVGWVVLKSDQSDESNIKDLKKDPLIVFQNRFYIPLAALVSFGLPTLLASLWGDPWGGLFIGGFLRMVINHHLTFLINSYAHTFGRQNFSNIDSARDSYLLAFFTYGEGYHNFHHTFESDYRNGIAPWHFDPGKWLIWGLSKLGLAQSLKKASPQLILAKKLAMDEFHLRQKLGAKTLSQEWEGFLVKTRERIEHVHTRYEQLKKEYALLRQEKMAVMQDRIVLLKSQMTAVKEELGEALHRWGELKNGVLLAQNL